MMRRTLLATCSALILACPVLADAGDREDFLDLLETRVPRSGSIVLTATVDAQPQQVFGLDLGTGAWFTHTEDRLVGRTRDGAAFERDPATYEVRAQTPGAPNDVQNMGYLFPSLELIRLREHPERITAVERDPEGDFVVDATFPFGRFADTQEAYDRLGPAYHRGAHRVRLYVDQSNARIRRMVVWTGDDDTGLDTTLEYDEGSPGWLGVLRHGTLEVEAYPDGRPDLFTMDRMRHRALSVPLGRSALQRIPIDRTAPTDVDPTGRFTIQDEKPTLAERFRTPLIVAGVVLVGLGVVAAIRRRQGA